MSNTNQHIPVVESDRPRGLTRSEVLTAREVAELLQLPVSTVYYLAREGKLPCSQLGRTYRFIRPALEQMLLGDHS